MKKKLLLLATLIPLISGCTFSHTYSGPVAYPAEELPAEEKQTNMIVEFYYDYSHAYYNIKTGESDAFYTMRWYSLTPLGTIPEQAVLTDADAKDPLYPTFLGYSAVSTCMDESLIWDFATDTYESNILRLYGVWVSKQEVMKYEEIL